MPKPRTFFTIASVSAFMATSGAVRAPLAQPADPPSRSFETEEPEAAAPPEPAPEAAPESPAVPTAPAAAAPTPANVAPAPPPGYQAPAYPYPPPYDERYEPPPPPQPAPKKDHFLSLTFSPLHLLLLMFEVAPELRLGDYAGIAVIGGIGEVPFDDEFGRRSRFTVYEIGGQAMFYPLEPFQSLQLGAELLYLHIASDNISETQVTGVAAGVGVGPLVGYKLITRSGFTFLVQGGVERIIVKAEVRDPATGNRAEDEESRWIPVINLNIGWSL